MSQAKGDESPDHACKMKNCGREQYGGYRMKKHRTISVCRRHYVTNWGIQYAVTAVYLAILVALACWPLWLVITQ